MSKAAQFQRVAMDALELAEEHYEVADAVATLCIHAGIAASEAICIARLGHFAQGQDHNDAVALLKSVDGGAAKHLTTLLGMKTRAGYGYNPINAEQLKKAVRAMGPLLDYARR
ncbi:hypothetical protein [Arthrobacter sp. StoSoilB22]|uniref:hypothetical protein n=1 Tax=Arthrobacter sp. StoSoilB22 TaxID=2830996 RepID=UPI001CC66016|nr:hypothetical protein [Arthrobacter sp. StoSoilB22]BCW61272.1 hypothetical protein StoSoilB22_02450 [Arthrobacter sp. StoSoilB22]